MPFLSAARTGVRPPALPGFGLIGRPMSQRPGSAVARSPGGPTMHASGDTGISEIGAAISRSTGRDFHVETVREAAGGCINTTLVVGGRGQRYFVKMNAPERVEMFAAEAEALQLLDAAQAVRVPNPICSGTAANRAYIALEFLELR